MASSCRIRLLVAEPFPKVTKALHVQHSVHDAQEDTSDTHRAGVHAVNVIALHGVHRTHVAQALTRDYIGRDTSQDKSPGW